LQDYEGYVVGGILGGAFAAEGTTATRTWLSVLNNAKSARQWCSALGMQFVQVLHLVMGGSFEVPTRGVQIFDTGKLFIK